jgi:hypothetical protein
MKTNLQSPDQSRSGVAVIIVLGLLATLLILTVAFIRTMRTERLAARNYSDDVRARNLAHVALIRAMEDVDNTMTNCCYPWWQNRNPSLVADAISSVGTGNNTTILSGEASNMIPRALWSDAIKAASNCYWRDIVSFDGRTNGRIAYLVVNCSGLLDANLVGGTNRTCSTNVQELSLRHIPEINSDANERSFYQNRAEDVRYETIAELAKLNPNALTDPVSNLFVYSYDPGRDVYFTNTTELGSEDISLAPKLNINDTTASNYLERLTNALVQAGFTNNAEIIAWNVMDYLDADRIPHNGGAQPWLDDTVCEDVPLINEVVLRKTDATNLLYRFYVELWYPFVTNTITPSDGFHLHIDVYQQSTNAVYGTYDYPITNMVYGDPNSEFLVFQTPDFPITVNGSNVAVSATNPVWFLAQVLSPDGPVDQAMDQLPFRFNATTNYSANDPRCNGHSNRWSDVSETLGQRNTTCKPWDNEGQGLPIYHANRPMKNIGEIGYIYCGEPWQDIQLVDYRPAQNFALPDLLTVRSNNTPTHGLVNMSSQQKQVLEALFYRMVIGYSNAFISNTVKLTATHYDQLPGSINGPFVNFRDLFDSVATNSEYASWETGVPSHTNGDMKEDAFRNVLEMVTFRQNIFTVIVAAQVYGPVGNQVVAERRAVAVVYRDAYTGKSFIRHFAWLTE